MTAQSLAAKSSCRGERWQKILKKAKSGENKLIREMG